MGICEMVNKITYTFSIDNKKSIKNLHRIKKTF